MPLVAVVTNHTWLSAGTVASAKDVIDDPLVTSVVVPVTMDVPEPVLDVA